MHPNFALRRLVDCVRPHEGEIQAVRVAVHSHFDFLVVLPAEWATWGARRVSPLTIIHRITEHLTEFAPAVRRDGRGIELYFKGVTCAVDVVPGFLVRAADQGSSHFRCNNIR